MGVWFDTQCGPTTTKRARSQSQSLLSRKEPFKLLGIEFAPPSIPLTRRLQTLGAMHWLGCFLTMGFGSLFLCAYILLLTQYWWLVALYGAWFIYDRHTPSRGGRRVTWFRKMRVLAWMKDYFPVKLIKTAELDPEKNYIIGYHPHGIISTGAFCNFATDATGFEDLFPGIKSTLLSLAGQFCFPIFREYFMTTGACSCSRESIQYLLTKCGTGNALVLVVGGAAEVLEARPGSYKLNALNRKGFVKIALQTGTSLVPCFSFGENDVYEQVPNPKGSRLRNIQERMRKVLGFASPFFQGRGIFQYSFGLLPLRRPINTVVGAPIDLEKYLDPSPERIEEVRNRYFQALYDLFEAHKADYGIPEDAHLEFM